MIKKIKQFGIKTWNKVKIFGRWCKKKIKEIAVVLGIIGVATAATVLAPPVIPSIIAEGEVIEFPYTDENVDEDFIIRTDQEVYSPLWAWNGFDVYVMVKNESGKNQQVSVSPFFSKDFTIESIAILDPNSTTIIKEPIYEEVCNDIATTTGTTTICHNEQIGEQDKEVMGKWNDISEPTFFSEEDYQQFISDNNIPVKDKHGRKAKQKFGALFPKNKTVYFKVRLKSNEPFSIEEFDLEIIGDKGGYGLLDPTVFSDDFNSYNDGDLAGQGGWTRHSGTGLVSVQGTTVYEGAKAVQQKKVTNNDEVYKKTGTLRASGRVSFYMQGPGDSYHNFQLCEGASQRVIVGMVGVSNDFKYLSATPAWVAFDTYTVNTWVLVEIEWQGTGASSEVRYRINEGNWTNWLAPYKDWTSGLDTVWIGTSATTYGYYDHIAEDPYSAPSAEEYNMQVQVIGG